MKIIDKVFRFFTLFAAMAFTFSSVAMAESVNINYLKYDINTDEGYAVITGRTIGGGYSVTIPEEVEYKDRTYPVTEIGTKAFELASSLKINFPKTIRKVGADAFKGASISSVDIADFTAWAQIEFENQAANPFYYTLSDQKVGNTYLNGESFSWNQDTPITIDDNVTRIGSYAFICTGLRNIKLPETLTSIGAGAFQQTYIQRIEIPNSVSEIGESCFYDCIDLSYISLPENLKEVTKLMLRGCSALTSINIPDKVEKIGNLAFNDCSNLRTVKFGNVTYFDWFAFKGCEQIEQVTVTNISAYMTATFCNPEANPVWMSHSIKIDGMEDGVIDGIPEGVTFITDKAFFECRNLKTVRLPNSIETIGSQAFANCTELTSIHFGTGLSELADNAFEGCTSLSSASIGAAVPPACTKIDNASGATLRVPEGRFDAYSTAPGWKDFKSIIADLDAYGKEKFATYILNSKADGALLYKAKEDVVTALVPSSTYIDGVEYPVTGVATGAFYGNKVLKSVQMPETVSEIGDYAFYNCSALTNVKLGENTDKIGDSAFAECWLLDGIKLPESLTELGVSTFQNCKSLTSIVFPKNLKVVPPLAFAGCSKLSAITIPEGMEGIRESAFRGCRSLEALATPMTLFEIDEYAFADCENITSLHFRPGLAAIGAYAFKNCSNFTELDIPNGVIYVGECSFWNCKSLRNVYLPASLNSLGASAFFGCHGIADVYSYSLVPPVCDTNRTTFHHYNSTLHVPQNMTSAYAQAHEWKKFITIKDDASSSTGLEEIETERPETFTVYTADGILIKEEATLSDIQALPRGLYIVNGKKLLK